MKIYRVGNVYEFAAEDEAHAIEQYHAVMIDLDSTEANFVEEC